LHVDGFVPEDATALLEHDGRFEIRREPCPTMDLRLAREAGGVVEALSTGPRARARRSLRRIAPITEEWADTPGMALEILDELITLHQRRWNAVGAPGAFSSDRAVAFHRDLALRLLERDAAVVYRARNAAGTLGCVYGFVERGRLLFYQGGMSPSADNRVATGIAVHLCCMRAALERGLDEYDFLAGDQRYKRELSNTERELVWASLVRRRPRPVLIAAGRRLRRFWRRSAPRRPRSLDERLHPSSRVHGCYPERFRRAVLRWPDP
jgi:CelD/BcsL family acetyltransferase involved in cellulose biosynthesis